MSDADRIDATSLVPGGATSDVAFDSVFPDVTVYGIIYPDTTLYPGGDW